MARRTLVHAALTLAVGLAGCDGSPSVLPAAPTSTALPVASPATPLAVPAGSWNLTTTLTSATGPQQCAVDISHMHVGQSYADWLLTIDRSGDSVYLVVSDLRNPSERYEYEGTVVGDVLAATIRNPAGAGWCGGRFGGRVTFRGESNLAGRFSADGRTLTADVVESIRLDASGEVIGLHYAWRAIQQ